MTIGSNIKNVVLSSLVGISLTCDSTHQALHKTVEDQKPDIKNILTTLIITTTDTSLHNKYTSDTIGIQIMDTLSQSDIGHTQKITTNNDTMQVIDHNVTINTIDTIPQSSYKQGPNNPNNIIIPPSPKEQIRQILSQQQCHDLLDRQLTKAIAEIIPEYSPKIHFDPSYMRRQAYILFERFFVVEDTDIGSHISFIGIQDGDDRFVTQHMDNMKHHITHDHKNGLLVRLLLTKSDLKKYIMHHDKEHQEQSNITKLYNTITDKGVITYGGGQIKFQKDIESVMNLY